MKHAHHAIVGVVCSGSLFFPVLMAAAEPFDPISSEELTSAQTSSAMSPMRQAAEEGNAGAQFQWGVRCQDGGDLREAAKWYRAAAGQGGDDAQYNLGVCYFLGLGVEKNMAEALNWWQKAA